MLYTEYLSYVIVTAVCILMRFEQKLQNVSIFKCNDHAVSNILSIPLYIAVIMSLDHYIRQLLY